MRDTVLSIARHRIRPEREGNRYQFFCEASGVLACTTSPRRADCVQQELREAWESEGREHFNRCHRCGRWVVDAMYNADTMECVDCSPWEETPQFCPICGAKAPPGQIRCPSCAGRLRYGGRDGPDGED